jgi:hypothetical protein
MYCDILMFCRMVRDDASGVCSYLVNAKTRFFSRELSRHTFRLLTNSTFTGLDETTTSPLGFTVLQQDLPQPTQNR